MTLTSQQLKLVRLVANHPGLDGIGLKGKGWRPQVHGGLRDAENAGLLVYTTNGGWQVTAEAMTAANAQK
jgi:hypothetical protein